MADDHASNPRDYTWVALFHEPGPSAPRDASLFQHPTFGEHVAFLERMQQRGFLVAAGPVAGAVGEGMTILRLPGADQLEEVKRLATQDDPSVASGFLRVSLRPWKVLLAGGPASD
jgi:uncharacterized protein YciI